MEPLAKCMILLIAALMYASPVSAACKSERRPGEPVEMAVEGSSVRLRIPPNFRFTPGDDCSHVRSMSGLFYWLGGTLDSSSRSPQRYDDAVHVFISFAPNYEHQPWQFGGEVAPHPTLPIDLYIRSVGVDINPAVPGLKQAPLWAVRGTKDIVTGRPYFTSCNLVPADRGDPKSVSRGAFPNAADVRCEGGVTVRAGDVAIGASIISFARTAGELDKIYRQVAEQINLMVVPK